MGGGAAWRGSRRGRGGASTGSGGQGRLPLYAEAAWPYSQRMETSEHFPPIHVLGLGMGEPLSPRALETLASAQVLAGGARLLKRFEHLPVARVPLAAPLERALDRLEQARREGLRVVVLADGDPLFYGIGARLAERFGPGNLRFAPGVSAVQLACARLGLPWQGLACVSLHGRTDNAPLLAALAEGGRAMVFTDAASSPDALARLFLDLGLDGASLDVLEDLGSPTERVRRFTPEQAAGERFSPLNLVLVQAPAPPQGPARLGAPDAAYEAQDSLMTKWPVRACCLAALRLGPGQTLWDVGAGCGAVGIEASALLGPGRVFAVEKEPARHAMVLGNVRRFGAWKVRAVLGQAPAALEGLPDPDRVFLGGSLGRDALALAACCRRLAPGGRVVASLVLLGSLARCREHFEGLGWPVEIVQVRADAAQPLLGDLRLAAQNPVFIVSADKPA